MQIYGIGGWMDMTTRHPAVAGQFYPSDVEELRQVIVSCFEHELGPGKLPPKPEPNERVVGIVSPHAGYTYSGPIAAHAYYHCSALRDIELVVIAGPNHWGMGSGVATVREGTWITPLGSLTVDEEAASGLVNISKIVDFDESAHRNEHSIEVQLPFLQYVFKKPFHILPISMAMQDRDTAPEVGRAIAEMARQKRTLLVASSDLTHYESHKVASERDANLIKAILDLDIDSLYSVLRRLRVTACGYGAIATIMHASKLLGATKGTLLKYGTSGDTGAGYGSVVGYASITFT